MRLQAASRLLHRLDVSIVSERSAGLAPVARRRAVYAAPGDLMTSDIHALSIVAHTPAEAG